MGNSPTPLEAAWFPSRMHAFVWRNWSLVSPARMAAVVGAKQQDIEQVGLSMGLQPSRGLSDAQRRRSSLTIIRRNWHLLPYDQLLSLLGWTAEEMAYTLREDDFFFVKLGLHKPNCPPLRWSQPTAAESARAAEIAAVVRSHFPDGSLEGNDPLFSFVETLSAPPASAAVRPRDPNSPLRMAYSFFALYGDPLLDPALNPYPDGYLARLSAVGANAVWLQAVLSRLSPLPWAPESNIDRRRAALSGLVARAARYGIKIFLYLNEPRSLQSSSPVFEKNPNWRGVTEQDFTSVCTSNPEVRSALSGAVADLCRAVPDLGGFFTITASENLTNCWSHGRGGDCPRCKSRKPDEVIAELNASFYEGIRAANGRQRLIAWDWGWGDDWAPAAIERLPLGVELMSVSEWSLPIERGGVKSEIGEYCLSAIGPGPRAKRHWAAARKRGLSVVAKCQFGVSWELSAVPYLPVVENVALHTAAIRDSGVENLMLGWTLGGHPSPNIEAVAEITSGGTLETLARRRHGEPNAAAAVAFWKQCSAAFRQFPFNGGCVYNAPLQVGPSNPLWPKPTGYKATMVGIPYDDLDGWRAIYPPDIFAAQLEKVAVGFEAALDELGKAIPQPPSSLAEEMLCIRAAAIHFAGVANQCRFVLARRASDQTAIQRLIESEITLAKRLHALQSRDSRLGFEASNQYYYIPLDLIEKVINCSWLASTLSTTK
ncbi:MAG: hypothetical protein GX455_01590 [Phycisphaerae bacterium]|nr:hypothetical protein [Phycisphaerae bacterium]